jgi:dTDP-4-dehydrorhamnose 3,5-epimerase
MLKVKSLSIQDVKIIQPIKHGDHRGFFSETYNKKALLEHGIDIDFTQDNHALSQKKYTLRGLHFQDGECAQDKLVRVVKGKILDVAVDLRHNSPTFGKYVSAIISAEEWNQILVPKGFAHGLLTLEDNTEVLYKTSDYYSPKHDKGLIWNDPIINIDWGVDEKNIVISEKDSNLPLFDKNTKYF